MYIYDSKYDEKWNKTIFYCAIFVSMHMTI